MFQEIFNKCNFVFRNVFRTLFLNLVAIFVGHLELLDFLFEHFAEVWFELWSVSKLILRLYKVVQNERNSGHQPGCELFAKDFFDFTSLSAWLDSLARAYSTPWVVSLIVLCFFSLIDRPKPLPCFDDQIFLYRVSFLANIIIILPGEFIDDIVLIWLHKQRVLVTFSVRWCTRRVCWRLFFEALWLFQFFVLLVLESVHNCAQSVQNFVVNHDSVLLLICLLLYFFVVVLHAIVTKDFTEKIHVVTKTANQEERPNWYPEW